MQDLCQGFDAADQTRPGPRKISAGVERVDTRVAHGGNRCPFFWKRHGEVFVARLRGCVAALGNEENLWRGFHYIRGADAEGRRALSSERIFSAGNFNHFRHPMARYIKRLKPFENSHSRPVFNAFQLAFEFPEARSDSLEQRFRLMAAECRLTYPQD